MQIAAYTENRRLHYARNGTEQVNALLKSYQQLLRKVDLPRMSGLYVGTRKLVKRRKFEEYIGSKLAI